MQTMKLRALQQPSQLAALLESLVMSQSWVPAGAPLVTDRSELPSTLQKLVIKAVNGDGAWRAWQCHDGARLFVTEMSMELSRERGCPALTVNYYNDQGRLQYHSLWIKLATGAWQRCAL
jgi:hypothetical protein